MERFNAWSTAIFNKPLCEVSVDEAGALAHRYPYFAPAQFLYLEKLKGETEKQPAQYQRSVLYYHQPEAFSFFLNPPADFIFQNPLPAKEEKEIVVEKNETVIENEITEKPIAKLETTADDTLTFEPFHTVDYFASQGIKISQEEVGKDKFGKQLKSFTDWLKTMKKLPATELAKSNHTGAEKKVQNLAAHSVDDAEIVTESMAEVWLKQGNKEKARHTYQKLSLQNPSKRAYFAAKIQSINEQ